LENENLLVCPLITTLKALAREIQLDKKGEKKRKKKRKPVVSLIIGPLPR
jgi:hypothetical protein